MVGSRHLGAHLWKPLPAPRRSRGRAVARPRLRRTVHRHRHRRRGPVAVPLRRRPPLRRRGEIARARDSFGSVYDTLTHAAMETSFVTVWVLVAFLVYEYFVLFSGANIATLAAAAGVLAPIGGAVVGADPRLWPPDPARASTPRAGCPFGTVSQCDRPGRRRPVPRYWPSTPGPPSSPRFTTSCPPSSSASRSTSCGAPCSMAEFGFGVL